MTLYPSIKVFNPQSSEVEILRSIDVLVDAFQGDPFTDTLLGGDLSLSSLQLGANIRAAVIGGEVHVLSVGPEVDDIVGVAIWYPPGTSDISDNLCSEEERAVGWNEFLEKLPTSLKDWWMDYFIPKMKGLSTTSLGEGYQLSSWHLHIFGVAKAHQGKGYGKALFKYAEEKALATKAPMVLETTNDVDVAIYKKLGFIIRGEMDLKSEHGDACVKVMSLETC
ncbi:hypothetical protein BJ165DRAFT_1530091 [Panaeolus papilionaceus]|nr:hypothetical protein BJ165DRAFT_1530091 [Panaeolus papilionaceus]